MEKVYVPKSYHEKEMQRALIQYRNPDNYDLVVEALRVAHRTDLIGFDEKCLVRPRKFAKEKQESGKKSGFGNKNRGQNQRNGKSGVKQNGKFASKNAGKPERAAGKANKKKKSIRNVHKKK